MMPSAMHASRRLKRPVIWMLALAMLFMQLALSLYLCPMVTQAASAQSSAAAPPCPMQKSTLTDIQQPWLCLASCADQSPLQERNIAVDLIATPVLMAEISWMMMDIFSLSATARPFQIQTRAPPDWHARLLERLRI
jgi:hypothetical protein